MAKHFRQTRRRVARTGTSSALRPLAEPLEERQLLSNVFTVTNTLDDGSTGSLRWAITQVDGDASDSAANPDRIEFNIPRNDSGYAEGVWTIAPLTLLPTITNPVVIDGYTQSGASVNTNGPGQGDNARLTVALSGALQGPPLTQGRTGLTLASQHIVVRGLIAEHFASFGEPGGVGILIRSPGGDTVEGNFLGTDNTSSASIGNYCGVAVNGNGNTIGGSSPDARNVISGNIGPVGVGTSGVILMGNANLVEGNLIGTNTAGNGSVPNSYAGVIIGGADNTVGGTTSAARNVIVGNNLFGAQPSRAAVYGVLILGQGASDNVVEGNFIGTDVTGTVAIASGTIAQPNTTYGVAILGETVVDMVDNTIGGTAAGAGNVIAGNGGSAILVGRSNETFNTVIQGNYIGTDATGMKAVPNGSGIEIDSSATTIGGTTATARNVIAGNQGNGITIVADYMAIGVSDISIEGNYIGTDASGHNALGNGGDGVVMGMTTTDIDTGEVTHNTVGGTALGAANVIAFNQGAGVAVLGGYAFANPIEENSIYGNAKLGIDVGGSGFPLVNIPGDSLDVPKKSQNYPFVTGVLPPTGGSLVSEIVGTLDSVPNQTYRIEFFSNSTPDPSGFGQAQIYLGSMNVTTDSRGAANFSLPYGGDLGGQSISATATDAYGNTSEFSPDAPPAPQGPAISLTAMPNPGLAGQLITVTAFLPSTPLRLGNTTLGEAPVRPMGFVAFYVDGHAVPSPALLHSFVNAQGVAGSMTFATIPALGPGPHTITAHYEGANFPPSDSAPLTVTVVNNLPSVVGLTVSPDPASVDQSVTFTAAVTSFATVPGQQLPSPGGFVDFREGTVTLAHVPVDATGRAVFTTSTLGVGSHQVVAYYEGSPLFAPGTSNTVTAFVNPAVGPTVLSVRRHGIHAQPTAIVLTFSQPLDTASAENTNNYVIRGPGRRRIPVNFATYNAGADTVTLTPARNLSLHARYTLTVNGTPPRGVADVYGNLLDGAGHNGTDYVTTLTRRNLVPTGPHRHVPRPRRR